MASGGVIFRAGWHSPHALRVHRGWGTCAVRDGSQIEPKYAKERENPGWKFVKIWAMLLRENGNVLVSIPMQKHFDCRRLTQFFFDRGSGAEHGLYLPGTAQERRRSCGRVARLPLSTFRRGVGRKPGRGDAM